jgi:hypothetical protein
MGRSRRFTIFGQNNDTAGMVSGKTYADTGGCNEETGDIRKGRKHDRTYGGAAGGSGSGSGSPCRLVSSEE